MPMVVTTHWLIIYEQSSDDTLSIAGFNRKWKADVWWMFYFRKIKKKIK